MSSNFLLGFPFPPGVFLQRPLHQDHPLCAAGFPVLAALGLEPVDGLPVQGDGHLLDEAGIQGGLPFPVLFDGLWEQFFGGLGVGPISQRH